MAAGKDCGVLAAWAERTGRRQADQRERGNLRFAFYVGDDGQGEEDDEADALR